MRRLDLLGGSGGQGNISARAVSEWQDVRAFDWTADGKIVVSDGSKLVRTGTDGADLTTLISDPNAGIPKCLTLRRWVPSFQLAVPRRQKPT